MHHSKKTLVIGASENPERYSYLAAVYLLGLPSPRMIQRAVKGVWSSNLNP